MESIRQKQKIISERIKELKAAPIYKKTDLAIECSSLMLSLQNDLINEVEKLKQQTGE